MAALFAVGLPFTYDGTTNHFATTTGGSATVAAVTSTDTVTVDGNSGNATMTIGAAFSCSTLTINNTSATVACDASHGITAAGAVTLTQGTLNTNGQTCSWGSFISNNANVRTLTLGTSAITITGGGTAWSTGGGGTMTVTANTANITMSGASANFSTSIGAWGGTLSYTGSGTGQLLSTGGSIGNLTRTGTATRTDSFLFASDVTVSGTLTLNGNSTTNRLGVGSSVAGTQRTITAATISASNIDISDIIGAGAANWDLSAITGLSGDAGNNSGMTLTGSISQSSTVVASGTTWSNIAIWPTRIPLPQDDVNFRGFSGGGQTITLDMPRLGRNVTFASGTGGYTVAPNSGAWGIYGNFATQANTFWAGGSTNGITLRGRSSHTITFAGSGMAGILDINTPTGSYTLTRSVSMSGNFTLTQGSFNDGGFGVTCATFASSNTNTRSLTRSGNWSLTSTAAGTVWNLGTTTGLTYSDTSATITIGATSASSRTITGGGLSYGTLTYTLAGSTGALVITGSNSFGRINFSDATNARTLQFTAGTTTVITSAAGWNVNGTAGKLMSVQSVTAATHTISIASGTVSSDYLSLTNSIATGGASFYAGANSTNVSGNSGWFFTVPQLTSGNFFNFF